ncbi:MAG: MATE family efflux transporter [Clostridia bacterium]|nr:MATE family efflux transporter [Clostridia bacterium]
MRVRLSDHFNYKNLIRFVLPSVIMLIFTSIYGVIDGLFVSNFSGKAAITAINLIFPPIMMIGGFGFMVGAGGTAIVSRVLGENDGKKANSYFSMFVYFTAIGGTVISAAGVIFAEPLARMLGAKGEIFDLAVLYGQILFCSMPFFMLQNLFQSFFVAAEKAKLGLAVTVIAGCTNIVFDALLVAVFEWGLTGAALATALSQFVGGILPVFYFARKNDSLLRLGKTRFKAKTLLQACINGSSELLSNISSSIVIILYNFQLLKFAGEDGVAAYGVIGYVGFIFIAVFIGYSVGIAPVIGYNYGADNRSELKNIFRKSLFLLTITETAMVLLCFFLSKPISALFVGYDKELMSTTVYAMQIYAFSFLFCGFSIFGSSFFTALGNGPISAAISFMRTLVFQALFVLLLPMIFGMSGIWFAMIAAEAAAFAVTAAFILAKSKKYGYM